jgi:uncharacterized protein YecE (DUF72 family)
VKEVRIGCSGWSYRDWRGFAPRNALTLRKGLG